MRPRRPAERNPPCRRRPSSLNQHHRCLGRRRKDARLPSCGVHQLEVVVLDESHIVSTPAELIDVMSRRIDGGNHFQIASAASPYPLLDLLVRDRYAAVHYWV